jgi:glycosyltransferase involved in cell wall biosynthesis
MKKLSIVLCSYNEENSIKLTLKNLIDKECVAEIIIVDDNSQDNTVAIINSFNNAKIKLYIRKNTKGLASAFIFGVIMSKETHILRFDVDMHSSIDYFLQTYLENKQSDCVIFSRYVKNGIDQRNNLRKISSFFLNKVCQIFLSNKIKDYTSCIFFFNKNILQDIQIKNTFYANFIIYLVFDLIKKKKNYLEVPFVQEFSTQNNSKSAPNLVIFCTNGFFYLTAVVSCFLKRLFVRL